MTSAATRELGSAGGETESVITAVAPDVTGAATSHLRNDQVWRALIKGSFAVLSYVTPTDKPRSSGVVYATVGRCLYVVVEIAEAWTGWPISRAWKQKGGPPRPCVNSSELD